MTRIDRVARFEELRPLLFSIAYRILGSVSEAEDAVQETWLRWDTAGTTPVSAKAFLSTVVTRISINVLDSARVRREAYVGPWFPEPLVEDPYRDPERSAELADSVSMAALLLLERLSALERAVFVLRDVFGFGYAEVAEAVGRSEPACRQLAARARRHMEAGRPRFEADRGEREELPSGSSSPSETVTSTVFVTFWRPTFAWSATVARPRRVGARASSVRTRWPVSSLRSSHLSYASVAEWSRAR